MTNTTAAQPFKTLILDLLRQSHLDEEAFLQQLNETERTAIGTWKLWSVKDHVAHKTFWHQNLVLKLTAILQHQKLSSSDQDEEQFNSNTFERNGLRPWSDIHAEAEQVYTELIKLTEQLSEVDLTTPNRYSWISGERPLYARCSWAAVTSTTKSILHTTISTVTILHGRLRFASVVQTE